MTVSRGILTGRKSDPDKKSPRVCPRCGTSFLRWKTQPGSYCSKACQDATRAETWTEAPCPECGKVIRFLKCWPRTYCSHSCRSTAIARSGTGLIKPSRYTATCETCGRFFETTPGVTRGRFCSQPCYGAWLSKNVRGDTHHRTGRTFPRPKHWPAPTVKQCAICGAAFTVKPSAAADRVCCSKDCHNRRYRPDGPEGTGYEPYYGPSWVAARRAVRKRDKVCVDCGKTPEANGRALDVHHVIRFAAFGLPRHKEANALTNLVAVCMVCHTTREWTDNRLT